MNDYLKAQIEDLFGECTTAEEICLTYAELYCFIKEQMRFCIDEAIIGGEEKCN